jgi:hypothetical protein
VRLDQPGALTLLPAGDVAALGVAELDARLAREVLDRLGEGQMVDLLDEGDRVAALATAEAVPEAVRDIEGG